MVDCRKDTRTDSSPSALSESRGRACVKVVFWVGSYSSPAPHVPEARGRGIYRGALDLATGGIQIELASSETIDPTYLAVNGDLLAAVSEQSAGELHLYEIQADGSLNLLRRRSSGGASPCHVAAIGRSWGIANYNGDRLQVVDPEGSRVSGQRYIGAGPVSSRQGGPHLHQVCWIRELCVLAVSDLGSDRVWLHRVETEKMSFAPFDSLRLSAGAGPRHMVWHARNQMLFVLGELDGAVHSFQCENKRWRQVSSCQVGNPVGGPSSAAIRLHPSGRMLYTSERSASRIDAYSIRAGGGLRHQGTIPSGGLAPRDFNIDPTGRWLLVANQDSNLIVTIPLDPEDGAFAGPPLAPVACGTPVCICFQEIETSQA